MAVETTEIHRLTLNEYHDMARTGLFDDARIELLDGLLVDLPVRSPAHENVVASLLETVLLAVDRTRFQVRASAPLTLGASEPEPDVIVVPRDAPQPFHPGHAALVVEVSASSLRRDLGIKPRIYAAGGIPLYWVIDLDGRRAVVHSEPGADGYARIETCAADATLLAPALGVSVALAELLGFSIGD